MSSTGGNDPFNRLQMMMQSQSMSTQQVYSNMSPQPKNKVDISSLKKGDVLKVVSNYSGHPCLGRLIVYLQDAEPASASSIRTNDNWFIDVSELELVSSKKTQKAPEFDPSKLDNLILDEDSKNEIIAVLKQHKYRDTLFTKWGLGKTIEYGKGMTFLFYGVPGTGKTWATECIAKSLDLELMRVSTAEIESSEPGGAERNLKEAFKAAEDKVLLIDECDSLIFSRENLGMVLGSQVNSLLTEIERFEGVVILTTNRIGHLDKALERRIALIIEFNEPSFIERGKIWRTLIPESLPLDNVPIEKLSEFKLTGGEIKNVILQACRLALGEEKEKVDFSHFERAFKRLKKSNSVLGTKEKGYDYDIKR